MPRIRYAFWLCALLFAGCGDGGGKVQGTDAVPVNNLSDAQPPVISITEPQSVNGSYGSIGSTIVTLAGIATDNVSVTRVSWRNIATGASGLSTGTVNWHVNNIVLVPGINSIVVTAFDAAGNSGSTTLLAQYSPATTPMLSGQVDSTLIARNRENAVYIYSGNVVPDDLGGAGAQPYTIIPVVQDSNACTWSYRLDSLPAGEYTLAFTNNAQSDNPAINDTILFSGRKVIDIVQGQEASHSFSATSMYRVGPGRTYSTAAAVSQVARDGDLIEFDAGIYDDDIVVWRQNNLTLRGIGGMAHMRATREIPYAPGDDKRNGKGIWVVAGSNVLVENFEFSGATVADENGAGIRHDGDGLTVCNGYFHDNENGLLGGGGDMLIEYSEFANNGFGDGQSHNMYIDGANRFTLRFSYTHHARIGHNIKSRASENHILYNRIMDEQTGTASYAIDLPDCGVSYLIGNLIQQGQYTDNSTIISYGAEGCLNPVKELNVVNNTLVNDLGSGTFISVRAGTTARIINNIFVGNGKVLSGSATFTTNLTTNTPSLADITNYNFRLTVDSPARDAGSNPGSVNGVDLFPRYQYSHKAGREPRTISGGIDIGAYEYTP